MIWRARRETNPNYRGLNALVTSWGCHDRVFPIARAPYAGFEHMLSLFEICRELGDPNCLIFNENGYTTDYKPFDTKEVIEMRAHLEMIF